MTLARWIWSELTRPRGRSVHRFYRGGRRSQGGVALLLVLTSIMLLTILVTEITRDATMRMQLAAQYRDQAKAEMLAYSGLGMYRLILVWSKQLGKNPMISQYAPMLGINADSLWQVVPFINTTLLRMVFVTKGDVDEKDAKRLATEGLSDDERADSMEGRSAFKRQLLDFDGDFEATVADENKKIFVGDMQASTYAELLENPYAQQLQGLMSGEQQDLYLREANLDKWELIGNLADWTDVDNNRVYKGGVEDSLYQRLDSPYMPKNAPFDTVEEIRLVDGWNLDEVWTRYGQYLTIYGGGKVNINTADRRVLSALLMTYVEPRPSEYTVDLALNYIIRYRSLSPLEGGGLFTSPKQFMGMLAMPELGGFTINKNMEKHITTESSVFRVTAIGEVRDAKVTIDAVFDFSKSQIGKVVYWRVR